MQGRHQPRPCSTEGGGDPNHWAGEYSIEHRLEGETLSAARKRIRVERTQHIRETRMICRGCFRRLECAVEMASLPNQDLVGGMVAGFWVTPKHEVSNGSDYRHRLERRANELGALHRFAQHAVEYFIPELERTA